MRKVFAEVCLHFVGNDEHYGKKFSFEPWQDDIWDAIFGTGSVVDGRFKRRFRRALIGIPRGLGKTVNSCAMLLSEATMNPVHNGQYGLIADSEDNAKNAFQTLTAMVRTSKELSEVWECFKAEIRNRENGSWIRTFPNKIGAVQGWHFNFCIMDELHVYRDDGIWKAVNSGQRSVPDAFTIGITTASDMRDGFLWNLFTRVREGKDPACFLWWAGIDDNDNPQDRSCWEKVMISPRVTMDALEEQYSVLGPRDFMRYQLNFFPPERYEEPFVEGKAVSLCEGISNELDRNEWYAVGVDGATSGDDTAVVAAQQKDDGTWAFKEWVWHGMRSDFEDVADLLTQLANDYGRPTIVIDPNRLKMMKDWLWNNRQIDLYDFPQTPKAMAPASERLRWIVRNQKAALCGRHEIARALRNAVSVESKAYGDRISSTGHGAKSPRIDAAVAAAMAIDFYDSNIDEHIGSSVATIDF